MKLYDVKASEQDLVDSGQSDDPVFDETGFGKYEGFTV